MEKNTHEEIEFEFEKHIIFFKYIFKSLKDNHQMETHKITILYFIVGGLKILNALTEEEKEMSVSFVLNNTIIENKNVIGFRGGNFSGWSYNKDYTIHNQEDKPHLAATYCALCILKMCDYNSLNKINEKIKFVLQNEEINFNDEFIIKEVLKCQNENGEFSVQSINTENDVRFFYCAMAILKLLNKSSEEIQKLINFKKSKEYLNSIMSYEGGFSMTVFGESNAGLTYCAVASFHILNLEIPNLKMLIRWLNSRNSTLGVNGRTNKVPDTCYSFWVMGSLYALDKLDLFDREHTLEFILNCQTLKGGFSKHLNFDKTENSDLLHSFYSLASLSLLNYSNLNKFDPILAIPI